jgi:RNA polymerase subunit RPABC4/transcription elongation factor Spt4
MVSVCNGCHQPLVADARFCPNCGTRVVAVNAILTELAAPTGHPICGACGLIAPIEHNFCSVCDDPLPKQGLYAPVMPAGFAWAALAVRFECRACRQLAPLNHLDVDGHVKCMHRGVEQRFDGARWQAVIDHAKAVVALGGPMACGVDAAVELGRTRNALGTGGRRSDWRSTPLYRVID